MLETICFRNRQLKPNTYDYLNTSFLYFYVRYGRMVQACIDFMNVDIMQFRQHYARADKQNANFDYYFWHKGFC